MSMNGWWVIVVVMTCFIGLWALVIVVLRLLSRELDDGNDALPFKSLSSMLENAPLHPGEGPRPGGGRQTDIVTAGSEE
jgi:hypothetical protein